MVSAKVKVINQSGFHLRPAGYLCKEALKFQSYISYTYKEGAYNAKSVLSVLGSCIKKDDVIEIFCEGNDEEQALEHIVNIIKRGLNEIEE